MCAASESSASDDATIPAVTSARHETDEQGERDRKLPEVSVRARAVRMARVVVTVTLPVFMCVAHQAQQSSSQPSVSAGTAAHAQPSPSHASRPSLTASAAIASAITGSSHHNPNNALAKSPTSTPTAM